MPGFLVDIISWLEWVFQTLAAQIDNREIATLILLAAFFIYVCTKDKDGSIRKSFGAVIKCAAKPKLFIPAVLLISYSVLLINLTASLGIWSSSVLLDTILEVIFVGLPSMTIAANAHTITSMFKQLILPEVGIGAFAAFYIGIESFSIPVEILIQIVIFIFTCGKVVWERQPNGKRAVRFSDWVLALVGIAIFSAMTYRLISSWNTIDWMVQLQTFSMAIWYPLLLIPFVISLGYYASFEMMRFRIKTGPKTIKPLARVHLYLMMFPSLRNITHYSAYEAEQYAECPTWKEQSQYGEEYKKRIEEKATKENTKLERMEAGKGMPGFDKDGLWLDWENLEKIKTALWTVASVQNRNWSDNHAYTPDMQDKLVNVFTPCGCIGGSFVSRDRKSYTCWMSNGTGFTFGMGASFGEFPPLRYEGSEVPFIDPQNPLGSFISEQQEEDLPNWFENFHTDSSYR